MYTVDYFINKFEQIAESKWCIDTQQNHSGQCCAFGHCNKDFNPGVPDGEYWVFNMLSDKYEKLLNAGQQISGLTDNGFFAKINNGNYSRYQQETPKQRILAALYDIKKMQGDSDTKYAADIDTSGKEEKKERIVYVSVPVSITEQSKALVLS